MTHPENPPTIQSQALKPLSLPPSPLLDDPQRRGREDPGGPRPGLAARLLLLRRDPSVGPDSGRGSAKVSSSANCSSHPWLSGTVLTTLRRPNLYSTHMPSLRGYSEAGCWSSRAARSDPSAKGSASRRRALPGRFVRGCREVGLSPPRPRRAPGSSRGWLSAGGRRRAGGPVAESGVDWRGDLGRAQVPAAATGWSGSSSPVPGVTAVAGWTPELSPTPG